MFVVCGRETDGSLRVWDTEDNTVEEVSTVWDLKVVESMGYQVVFDENQDYIYKLWYSNFDKSDEVLNILKSMPNSVLSGMNNLSLKWDTFGVGRDVVSYLIIGDERVVLVSISRYDCKYKMHVCLYVNKFTMESTVRGIYFYSYLLKKYPKEKFILLGFEYGTREYIAVFDLECNFITLADSEMVY